MKLQMKLQKFLKLQKKCSFVATMRYKPE